MSFDPKYNITTLTLNNIGEITEIKAVIERSRVLPLNEALLRRQAILRMAHTSTSIEGNKLAEFQVGKIIEGQHISAPEKDIVEVENYYKALQLLESMSKSNKTITVEEILNLHKTVIGGLVDKVKEGKFRPGDVYVLDDLGDGREQLRFKAPPAKKVAGLINELIDWLDTSKKDGVHPIIRAAILHLQFVSIHPFTDGNGRVARLLTQLQLYRDNWDFRKILVLEDFYNRDRLAYYNAEHEVQGYTYNGKADFSPWLQYFTTGFLIEAQKVMEKVEQIGFGKISKKSEQIFLDRDEIQIMDFLTTTGRITSEDVIEILGIAKRTAQLKLKKLVDNNLLKRNGSTTATYYTLSKQ